MVWGFIAEWGVIVVLLTLSALFSGLTLGLLSLDVTGLEIIIGAGDADEARYARRIYPLRKRGNLLLCTLLLGNAAVNSLLAILIADKTSGLLGALISTGLIVVFGEISPQAICSRHGLIVGYYSVWIVWIFMIAFFPVAYPVSVVLNIVLGREMATIYSRQELKKLLVIHSDDATSDLTHEETEIISNVLDFSNKKVSEVMTDIEDLAMLEIDEVWNYETFSTVMERGYSRLPIYEKTKQNIVGLLFLKDLALLNPEQGIRIREILKTFNRNLPRVFFDEKLGAMLNQFKSAGSHMAVVRRVNDDGPGDPYYENVGVITLEDVIEAILNDEIVDETDVYVPRDSGIGVNRETLDYRKLDIFHMHYLAPAPKPNEIHALCTYLPRALQQFQEISASVLYNLISQSVAVELEGKPGEPLLYVLGKPSSYFTIIVSGKVEYKDSTDTEILEPHEEIEKYPCMGINVLVKDRFVSYFSARAIAQTRVIKIHKRAYHAAIDASKIQPSISTPLLPDAENDKENKLNERPYLPSQKSMLKLKKKKKRKQKLAVEAAATQLQNQPGSVITTAAVANLAMLPSTMTVESSIYDTEARQIPASNESVLYDSSVGYSLQDELEEISDEDS